MLTCPDNRESGVAASCNCIESPFKHFIDLKQPITIRSLGAQLLETTFGCSYEPPLLLAPSAWLFIAHNTGMLLSAKSAVTVRTSLLS
jgi:hypothetical protein